MTIAVVRLTPRDAAGRATRHCREGCDARTCVGNLARRRVRPWAFQDYLLGSPRRTSSARASYEIALVMPYVATLGASASTARRFFVHTRDDGHVIPGGSAKTRSPLS